MFDIAGQYEYFQNESIKIIGFPALHRAGCTHGFTTRGGGVSGVPFDTLNLGFNRPEPRSNILENYRRLCSAHSVDFESMALASYVHGCDVLPVTAEDCGRGITRSPLPPCDGLVTNDPDVTLLTLHADCAAYFVYDPVNRAGGLAHAGWRGTLGRIGRNVIEALVTNYGSRADDLIVGVGPGICSKCFEVGLDVAGLFVAEYGHGVVEAKKDDKAYIDLHKASVRQFKDCGVRDENIHMAFCCTYENEDLFFSYRRDARVHIKTGAMCAFMNVGGR